MQRLTGPATRPSYFAIMFGSARFARAMATRSAFPLRMTASASSMSVMRLTAMTGMETAAFTRAALSALKRSSMSIGAEIAYSDSGMPQET